MEFWASKNMEPKRQFRWTLGFGDGDQRIPAFICKSAGRPSFSQTEAEADWLNHKFYFPGRVAWDTLTVTLRDAIDPNAARRVLDMIRDAGYRLPETANALSTVTKSAAIDAMGELVLTQLNGAGEPLEIWTLKNAWIKDVKFSDLDYASDGILEIEVTFRFDFAELIQMPASSDAGVITTTI